MKTVQIFAVSFLIKKSKLKNDLAPIYCRIAIDGKRAEIALKQMVHPSKWSAKAGKAAGNSQEAREINNTIDLLRNKILKHYNLLLLEEKHISANQIKNSLLGIGESKYAILDTFRYHNERLKAVINIDVSKGTHTKFETVKKKLENFIKKTYRQADIPLNAITYKFITDFEYYLKTAEKISHNTAVKYIHCLRKIIKMSIRNEWLEKDPFANYKSTLNNVKRDQLTQEEIEQLINKTFQSKRLEEVRDIFIFCCYTGYAYIDVQKLSPTDLVTGIDGEKWIYTERTKTKITSNVPLLPAALRIVTKYQNEPYCRNHNKLLPVKSNQKMNEYLKEIAAIAGIDKNLTMHLARHTFATTITLSNGVPIETVSKMLGHTKLATTQIYAKVLENKVSADMNKLKNKLFQNSSTSFSEEGNRAG